MTADLKASATFGLDPTRLLAWRRFLEAHAYVLAILEQELESEEGLPLAWYDVLVHLSEADDRRLRMQDLADAVLLSKSGLSRLVDRMADAGLVRREACEADRRGTFAVLTDAGWERLRATAATHVRGVDQHFASLLTDSEAQVMATALDRIVATTGRLD